MQDFKNILFVSRGLTTEELALKQALDLCSSNAANLKIIVFIPHLPNSLHEYKQIYQDALLTKIRDSVKKIAESAAIPAKISDKISITIENNEHIAVDIVKIAIADKIDLIIKAADESKSISGLNAVDMALLRRSPCPVWICKPDLNKKPRHLAVTLEPNDTDPVRVSLSQKLLRLADHLAQLEGAQLTLISTWDCPFEEVMHDSVFYGIPKDLLDQSYKQEESRSKAAVATILQKTPLKSKYNLVVKKGITFLVIPEILTANKIDLLVIGTVARTGIPGFIIGNSAENIFQRASCSILALKPDGYISPIG